MRMIVKEMIEVAWTTWQLAQPLVSIQRAKTGRVGHATFLV